MQNIASPPQANAEVVINENFVAVNPAALYGIRQPVTTGLTWGYYGGQFNGNTVADGTVTLTASNTNYVVALRSTGVVSVSTATTNWDNSTDYVRLYSVVAGASTVTSYVDFRQAYGGTGGGGGAADFIDLADVPSNYAGAAGQFARVNVTEDGLEFATPAGAGDVSGPGVTVVDHALARWDGTTGTAIEESGVLVTDNDEISGYRGNINAQTGTSYTFLTSDSGKVVECSNASAITLTMPNNLPVGWCCTVVQGGAGAITFTPASGATRLNRQSHTKTAGQWAMVTLYVRTNVGGTAAEYVLGGDTAV